MRAFYKGVEIKDPYMVKPFMVMAFILAASFLIQANDPIEAEAEVVARSTVVILKSTLTIVALKVRGATSQSVIQATGRGYTYLYVENEESTFNLFCAERENVTTLGDLRGKKIAPDKWFAWTLVPGMDFHCVCSGATGCQSMTMRGR